MTKPITKKERDKEFALKLLLLTAIAVHSDRVTYNKLKKIIDLCVISYDLTL